MDKKNKKMPVLAIIVGLSTGLLSGIYVEWLSYWKDFPKGLVVFTIAGTIIGALVQLVILIVCGRRVKMESQGLKDLPTEIAEFLQNIIAKMRYRKRVRCEVMRELAGHFEDCLEDIKDVAEREEKVREMIEGFGDAKVLGILMRRAKKRCRPMWRTVTSWTVRVAVLLFILHIVLFIVSKPAVTVDYLAELNRRARPVADESMNAESFYRKAAEVLGERSEDIGELLYIKNYGELTGKEKITISDYLEEKSEVFEQVKLGTEKPYYWAEYIIENPDNGLMSTITLIPLRKYREIAVCLCHRSRLRAEAGDYEGAFDDIIICFKFGYHLKQTKTLVEQLVGISIQPMAFATLDEIVYEDHIDVKLLAKIQGQIEEIYFQDDYAIDFSTEKLTIYDEIQRCFSADGISGGRLCLAGMKRIDVIGYEIRPETDFEEFLHELTGLAINFSSDFHILFNHPNKKETMEAADKVYDYYGRIVEKSPYELNYEGLNIDKEIESITENNVLLSILTPALWKVIDLNQRAKVGCGASITILGLLRYKEAIGEYPESLDELLEAGYIKGIPLDPYSDSEIVYRRDGDDFVLYSVSENFVDDGGVLGTDSDGEFVNWWQAKGGDYIFWPVFRGD